METIVEKSVSRIGYLLKEYYKEKLGFGYKRAAVSLEIHDKTFAHWWYSRGAPRGKKLKVIEEQFPGIRECMPLGAPIDPESKTKIDAIIATRCRETKTPAGSVHLNSRVDSLRIQTKKQDTSLGEALERSRNLGYILQLLHSELKWFANGTPEARNALSGQKSLNANMGYVGSLMTMLTGGEVTFQSWKRFTTATFFDPEE